MLRVAKPASLLWLLLLLPLVHSTTTTITSVLFNVTLATNVTTYEDKLLLYTLQGLVNRQSPSLFFDTGKADMDFPQSDRLWAEYLVTNRGVVFNTTIKPTICHLIQHFQQKMNWKVVLYRNDTYSSHLAATFAGIDGHSLPASYSVMSRHTCLQKLPIVKDLIAIAKIHFTNKIAAYKWAIQHLLPYTSKDVLFNADNYFNSVPSQGDATIMSLDYPVQHGAFIMNLSPLWVCDPLDCGVPPHRKPMPLETLLFTEIVSSRNELVSLFGWGDPEHAYTNITTHAGGVVFCTFSSANLAYWNVLSTTLNTKPLPIPIHDNRNHLNSNTTYILFETNEGDTPRILTSQFTSAWLSPNRGKIPIGWAVDPILGQMFPELWNFFISNTTQNDTFLAGVDGGGYIYLDSLGKHASAYEIRASRLLKESHINVVDVGVPQEGWPAVKINKIQQYTTNAAKTGTVPNMFMNACGVDWNMSINTWLPNNGPVVVSSVCNGPVGNDTSNGHYLYYYRDHLNQSNPESDLAWRIAWASKTYKEQNRSLFLLVFGGLGLYGGHKDYFTFLNGVMSELRREEGHDFVAVGAQEMARLALEARP
jgi:hypothetical protein